MQVGSIRNKELDAYALSGHGVREIAANHRSAGAFMLSGASKVRNDGHGDCEEAQDWSTGGEPVMETGRTNRKRMHVSFD